MAQNISSHDLNDLLEGKAPFALIDVREAGEYNATHIPGAALIPRRRIEYIIESSVPFKGTKVVVCCDDGRRSQLAAATLDKLGFTDVHYLEGGTNRWPATTCPPNGA